MLLLLVVLAVIMYQAILGIKGIPTQIVHRPAIFANAKSEVTWVVVAVTAVVTVVDVIAVITCCLICGVTFEVPGTFLWGLCL
jgi:hypothetical protein